MWPGERADGRISIERTARIERLYVVSPTIDYRPNGTSAIAFVLKGRARASIFREAAFLTVV